MWYTRQRPQKTKPQGLQGSHSVARQVALIHPSRRKLPPCVNCGGGSTALLELGSPGVTPYLEPVWMCIRRSCHYKHGYCEMVNNLTCNITPFEPPVICEALHQDGKPCGAFIRLATENVCHLAHTTH